MTRSGTGAPEPESHTGQVEAPVADDVSEPLGILLDRLSELSEDGLLSVIGAYEVTPDQRLDATISLYASGDVAAGLANIGVGARTDVDLVALGRRRVERVLGDWGEVLKQQVCHLWHSHASERDLVMGIAGVLVGLLHVVAMVLAGIALLIARYFIEKLCGPRTKRTKRYNI